VAGVRTCDDRKDSKRAKLHPPCVAGGGSGWWSWWGHETHNGRRVEATDCCEVQDGVCAHRHFLLVVHELLVPAATKEEQHSQSCELSVRTEVCSVCTHAATCKLMSSGKGWNAMQHRPKRCVACCDRLSMTVFVRSRAHTQTKCMNGSDKGAATAHMPRNPRPAATNSKLWVLLPLWMPHALHVTVDEDGNQAEWQSSVQRTHASRDRNTTHACGSWLGS
jgi:hypothetical protein